MLPSTSPTYRATNSRTLRVIHDYTYERKLGEGTFGEVYRATNRRTSELLALKRIVPLRESDGFPITSLREIKILKMLRHSNILCLQDVAVEDQQNIRLRATIYMVTPYMDHDLCGMLKNPDIKLTEGIIKCYMAQFLEGLSYLHGNYIFHRDIKSANLLVNNKGLLQIADFGLARLYDGDLPRPGAGAGEAYRQYTALVVTRWYRPPELFLGLCHYTSAIDMWGAGLIFAEMFERKPIMQGQTDLAQARMIFELIGNPSDHNMPGSSSLLRKLPDQIQGELGPLEPKIGNLKRRFSLLSDGAISFMESFLCLDWRKRTNAIDALKHPYLSAEPLPAKAEAIPQFEQSHEMDNKPGRASMHLPPVPLPDNVGQAPPDHVKHMRPGIVCNENNPYEDPRTTPGIEGRHPRQPPHRLNQEQDRHRILNPYEQQFAHGREGSGRDLDPAKWPRRVGFDGASSAPRNGDDSQRQAGWQRTDQLPFSPRNSGSYRNGDSSKTRSRSRSPGR